MPKDHMGFDRPWWWVLLPYWWKRAIIAREIKRADTADADEEPDEERPPGS